MKRAAWIILISSSLLALDYSAREEDNALQLKTPFGTKTVIGEYGLSGYHMEIPLDEFLPEKLREMKMRGENIEQLEQRLKESIAKESKETHTIETKIIDRTLADIESGGNGKVPPRVTVEFDDSDRLVLEANRLYNKRKYDEALAVVDELLRRKPDFIRGWVMKGSVLFVRGHRDLAQAAWKKAQALDPKSEDIKSILAKYK